MASGDNETPQSNSKGQESNQEQKDVASKAPSYLYTPSFKPFRLRDAFELELERVERALYPGSLDPQIVSILLNYLSRQQKSSSLTKDEVKSLIVEALNEATKAAEALKPKPGDVLEVAASQLSIIAGIYSSVLRQADRSFVAALVYASVGLLCFIAAVGFLLLERPASLSIISFIAGAFVEVISGVNFYLYGRASNQLSTFHLRLDKTQNFLLANSVCENLEGEIKQQTRAELVHPIANSSGIPVSRDRRSYPKDEPIHHTDKVEN